jgi:hypothetical protein
MLERKSVIDQLEAPRGGGTGVRIALLVVDGANEINCKYHRTFIPADGSAIFQMNEVAAHLADMGEAPLSDSDMAKTIDFHVQNNPVMVAQNAPPAN